MKNLLIIIFLLGAWQLADAQGVRRSTLGSTGMISQQNGIRVASSFGQMCPGCSVLESPDGIGFLRQGFQQPNANLSPCGFGSSIAVEPIETECGTYYNFEYLGSPTSQEVEFLWNFGSLAAPITSTEQNPTMIAFSDIGNTLISVTVTVPFFCEESVSANFAIDATAFAAMVSTTDVDCFGNDNGAIILDGFGGTEPYTYQWADSNDSDRVRTDLAVGDYAFTISDVQGCEWEGVASVGGPVAPIEIAQIALSPESCDNTEDGTIEIDILGGAEGYELDWSNGENTLRLENLSTGEYTVTVTDIKGCSNDTTFTIPNICQDGEENLFDIITPNDDGVNDFWNILGIENFPRAKVVIHNRWGELVWDTNNYVNNSVENAFSGLSNSGNELPTGAYYFVIRYNDEANTVHGGAVTLIR